VTEQEKQTRRARRAQERAAQGPVPESSAAEREESSEPSAGPAAGAQAEEGRSASGKGGEAIKDRNKRLRDEAARKRAQRKRERSEAAAEGLDAGERVDDALTRTAHATGKFLQKNIAWLQWVFVAGAAGSIGYLIYDYRVQLANEKATDALMAAVAAQQGRVAGGDEWRSPDPNLVDPRAEFASEEERLKAAEERYRAALGDVGNQGTRLFAHLGLAGVLYDQGRYADARAEYEAAKDDPAATKNPVARARAFEGIGLSLEAEGEREEAAKAFAQLADVEGYGNLGRYQQARLWHAQGESAKALETLKKVREDLVKDAPVGARPGFLQASVEELMRAIDPEAVPAPAAAGQGITPEQLQELQRQFEELQRKQQQLPQGAEGSLTPPGSEEVPGSLAAPPAAPPAPATPAAPAAPPAQKAPSAPTQASPAPAQQAQQPAQAPSPPTEAPAPSTQDTPAAP
jgi:tetratricopeptide (TPR) repeat protein